MARTAMPQDVVTRTLDAVDAAFDASVGALPSERLLDERYRKYRRLGEWQAEGLEPIGTAH